MILVFESDLLMKVVAACSRYYPRIASMLGVLAPGLGVAKIDPLQLVAAFLSTLFFVILIHELGYLIAGRCVGMRFLGLRVGPILLSNEFGKLKTSFHATGSLDGFALVKFESITRISHSLRIMVLGGPAPAAVAVLLPHGFC